MDDLHISYSSTPKFESSTTIVVRTISIFILMASVVAGVVYITAKRHKTHNRED
jgi:hypothetical protein